MTLMWPTPWDDLWIALVVWFYVLPWHPRLTGGRARTRWQWSSGSDRWISTVLLAWDIGIVCGGLAHGRIETTGVVLAGCTGYCLYRMWRNQHPPRKRWRKAASAAIKEMVERMKPRPVLVPVGTR